MRKNEKILKTTVGYRPKDLKEPITWLEERHSQSSGDTTCKYYMISGLVVNFMHDVYGHEKIKQIVNNLSSYPAVDFDLKGQAREKIKQTYLEKEIQKILGIDMAQFNEYWLDWFQSAVLL